MDRVVLAYTGGLDTCVCLHWLRYQRNLRVIAFEANLGQGEDLQSLGERALESGAEAAHVSDLRRVFVRDYLFRALKADARYESSIQLGAALSRPLIAAEAVRIARDNGCRYIAHGCTAKGNDQARFEAAIASLAPKLKIIAPQREWKLRSREDEIDYAKRHGLHVGLGEQPGYNTDRNLWGTTVIGYTSLEDPWEDVPEDVHVLTKPIAECPDGPAVTVVGFEDGVPARLGEEDCGPVALVERLNEIAGEHGIGRRESIENRLLGLKMRVVQEAPAATVLYAARQALEELVLSRDVSHFRTYLSQRYGELIYDGYWFGPLRKALDAFFDEMGKLLTGDVRVRLHKGTCTVTGRRSPYSLYKRELTTYGADDQFDRNAIRGFMDAWRLPVETEAAREQRRGGPKR